MELRALTFIDVLQPQLAGFADGGAGVFAPRRPGVAGHRGSRRGSRSTRSPTWRSSRRASSRGCRSSSAPTACSRCTPSIRGRCGRGGGDARGARLAEGDRLAPRTLSREIITGVDGHQSAMINRMRHGDMCSRARPSTRSKCSPPATPRWRPTRRRSGPRSTCWRWSRSARWGGSGWGRGGGDPRRRRRRQALAALPGRAEEAAMTAVLRRARGAARRDRRRAGRTAARGGARLGGDYADLYFEYRVGRRLRPRGRAGPTVGRGVTLGLGVRVLRGRRHRLRLQRGAVRGARCSRPRARRRQIASRRQRRRRSRSGR